MVSVSGSDSSATLTATGTGTATVTCRSGCLDELHGDGGDHIRHHGIRFQGRRPHPLLNDAAWDLCRELEREIGMQIFYLPEFNDTVEGAVVTYDTFASVALDGAYFQKGVHRAAGDEGGL